MKKWVRIKKLNVNNVPLKKLFKDLYLLPRVFLHRKPLGFLMFLGVIAMQHWIEMG